MTITETTTPIHDISIDDLHPADDNPRSMLGDLEGLAASIRAAGILEPLIVVEALVGGGFTIVAGHRRHAAATLAGLDTVPCVVRELTTEQRIEAMTIENLQRSDLTPLDEARAFQMLVDLGGTQRDIAERVGCSQSHVSRRLALGKLPDAGAQLLITGKVTVRQAEQLAALPDDDIDDVVQLVTTAASWQRDGEPVNDYAITNAISGLTEKRKHDKAETAGEASGLKRLTSRPVDYAGDHRPCKKTEATHWYLGAGQTSIVWARTAKAEQKAKAATGETSAAPAATPPYKVRQEARDRIVTFINELVERALTDADLAADLWARIRPVILIAEELSIGTWAAPRGVDFGDNAELLIACNVMTGAGEPDWNDYPESAAILRLLVDHGYRPGDGETIPDGFEIPTDDAPGITDWVAVDIVPDPDANEQFAIVDSEPTTDDSEATPVDDWEPPISDHRLHGQTEWETAHPDLLDKHPWGTYRMSDEPKILAHTDQLHTVDKCRHVIAFETRNGNRPNIVAAAFARLLVLES